MLINYNDKIHNYIEIGIDEAGRGPLLGRVYSAAVIWNETIVVPSDIKIIDSKKLKKKDIIKSAEFIMKNAIKWSVNYATEQEIDEINILQATMMSIHKNLDIICSDIEGAKYFILMDGTYFNKYKDIEHVCVKEGDSKYISIAAASILAKYHRDLYIEELCLANPDLIEKYGINTNKGYGTALHMKGIKTHGISSFHRKTFKPCSFI